MPLQNSRLVPPADGHNTTGQVDPAAHGNGELPVSLPGFPLDLDGRVNATTTAPGSNFPFNLDANSGDTIGISKPMKLPFIISLLKST